MIMESKSAKDVELDGFEPTISRDIYTSQSPERASIGRWELFLKKSSHFNLLEFHEFHEGKVAKM